MPRFKRPYVASLDHVHITRQPDTAVIEYADPLVGNVHLKIGPEIADMSDQDILDVLNVDIETREAMAAEYHHVAVEIPFGRPQLYRDPRIHHWLPKGTVLRGLVLDGGPDFETTICIDGEELSMEEFGQVLSSWNGWGIRVEMVPDDELHERPDLEVREPKDSGS